jgi:hypothetical protein
LLWLTCGCILVLGDDMTDRHRNEIRILGAVLALALASVSALEAQHARRSFPSGGMSFPPGGLGAGLPPVQPIPPLGGMAGPGFVQLPANGMSGRPFFPNYAYPGYGGGYAYPAYASPNPVTNVVVIEQPSMLMALPVATPARPEVHEYKFEAGPVDTSVSASDLQLFVVAMKDGTRQLASAVWAQGRELQIIDENGAQKRVLLSNVDRQTTQSLNRARNLNLRIP